MNIREIALSALDGADCGRDYADEIERAILRVVRGIEAKVEEMPEFTEAGNSVKRRVLIMLSNDAWDLDL